MSNTRIVATILAICTATVLTSCDSDPSAPEAAASTQSEAAPSPTTDMDSTPTSNTIQTADSSPDAALSLDVVNFGHHEDFDRVAFVLTGPGVPGYRVEYVDQAVQDGSGKPIDLAAHSILRVRITGVAYPFESGAVPYRGENPLLNAGSGIVSEVYTGQPYEGALDSFLAIESDKPPFRVSVLANPTRVVVDVAS